MSPCQWNHIPYLLTPPCFVIIHVPFERLCTVPFFCSCTLHPNHKWLRRINHLTVILWYEFYHHAQPMPYTHTHTRETWHDHWKIKHLWFFFLEPSRFHRRRHDGYMLFLCYQGAFILAFECDCLNRHIWIKMPAWNDSRAQHKTHFCSGIFSNITPTHNSK